MSSARICATSSPLVSTASASPMYSLFAHLSGNRRSRSHCAAEMTPSPAPFDTRVSKRTSDCATAFRKSSRNARSSCHLTDFSEAFAPRLSHNLRVRTSTPTEHAAVSGHAPARMRARMRSPTSGVRAHGLPWPSFIPRPAMQQEGGPYGPPPYLPPTAASPTATTRLRPSSGPTTTPASDRPTEPSPGPELDLSPTAPTPLDRTGQPTPRGERHAPTTTASTSRSSAHAHFSFRMIGARWLTRDAIRTVLNPGGTAASTSSSPSFPRYTRRDRGSNRSRTILRALTVNFGMSLPPSGSRPPCWISTERQGAPFGIPANIHSSCFGSIGKRTSGIILRPAS